MPTRRAKSKQNQWKCAAAGWGTIKAPPPQATNDEVTHKARNAVLAGALAILATAVLCQYLISLDSILYLSFLGEMLYLSVTVSKCCIGEQYSLEIGQQMYSA